MRAGVLGLEQLEADMQNFAVVISREVAQYAKKELLRHYEDILQLYYEDYSPWAYHRTSQLKTASYAPIYKSPHGTRSYGGILLTPERMHYDNGFDPEKVISDYLSGMHGGRIPAGFNPYMRLLRRANTIVAEVCYGGVGDKLIKAAKSKADLKYIR